MVGSKALHRRAERWLASADLRRALGQQQQAGRCYSRAACWERQALAALDRAHPTDRPRTRTALVESLMTCEAKAAQLTVLIGRRQQKGTT